MKIFATDFDGTLFFHQNVPQTLIDAIAAFQKAGNKFGLNTGRGLFSIEEIEELGAKIPFDFYITDNGTIFADKDKKIIHEDAFDTELLKEIVDHLPQEKLLFSIQGKYKLHPKLKGRWQEFERWDGSFEHPINSFSIECDDYEEVRDIAKDLESHDWPIAVHLNRRSVDVTAKGIDKATCFDALRDYFKDPDAEIIAAGDSYNDLIALEKADWGFTFPWAPEELKDKAEVVADLQEALKKLEESA